MSTLLSDVVVPEVFSPYVKEKANATSRLIASGAVALDPFMSALLSGGGSTFNIPGWKSKDGAAFNSDTDNPATKVVPDKVTTGTQIATRLNQNYHVGAGRFTTALAGSSALASVASESAAIYNANRQAHLVAMLDGMFAATGPLVGEIIAGTWSSDLLVDAEALNEDFTDGTGIIIADSTTFSAMRKENLITFRPLSEQNISFPDYLGYAVIVDDNLGAASAYVIKPGAIKMGVGTVFGDTYEDEMGGNGSGVEYLRLLDEYMLHVEGMAYTDTGANPNATALGTAANWDAVYDLKHIGVKRIDVS